jgi:methyl-accepting chemotaxis protein
MKIHTLKFKFIVFNIFVIIVIFSVLTLLGSNYIKDFFITEREESRGVVAEQGALIAVSIVATRDNYAVDIMNDYLSKYPDLIYCATISLASKIGSFIDNKNYIIYIKNEKIAREYEYLFSKRPEKIEVYTTGDMMNIISPVYGIDDSGEKGLIGYILTGFSLESLFDKLTELNFIIIISFITIILLVSVVIYFMTSLFLKPLESAVEVINNVADGDFTRSMSVKTKSEIGVLVTTVNKMVATWRSSIEKLKEVIDQTNTCSERMTDAGKQQEHNTAEQASAVSEITSTLTELNASSNKVNEKAEMVSKSSNDVLQIASKGEKSVKSSIREINSIRGKIKTISEHALNLSIEAQQIGSIVKTVSDISNKTDMLAINAGIEAARASEHGKGFSIVASEIRELADKSQKSADKIAVLIENIQSATNSTVLSTEEAIKGFQVGIKLILEAGHTIKNLIKHIQATVNYAGEIALASRQQTLGNEQVVSAMSNIDEGMKTTALSASQILIDSTNLKKLGNDLSKVAGRYKI